MTALKIFVIILFILTVYLAGYSKGLGDYLASAKDYQAIIDKLNNVIEEYKKIVNKLQKELERRAEVNTDE